MPEGWWKVVYTKDGYLPAESRVLKVLPRTPTSTSTCSAPNRPRSRRSRPTTRASTVTLSQPTRVAQALSGALTVTTPDGAAVGGQWTAVSPQSPPAGHPYPAEKLAMAFRFTGEKRSGEVKVVVDPLLQDHGGRAVAEGVEKTLTVRWTGPDSAGPQVSVTGVADGATYRLRARPRPAASPSTGAPAWPPRPR